MCYIYILRYKTFEENHRTLQIVIALRCRYVITDILKVTRLVPAAKFMVIGNMYKYFRSLH